MLQNVASRPVSAEEASRRLLRSSKLRDDDLMGYPPLQMARCLRNHKPHIRTSLPCTREAGKRNAAGHLRNPVLHGQMRTLMASARGSRK